MKNFTQKTLNHDGFPAYRVEVTDENGQKSQIYFYDPYKAGKSPMSLFPPMECKVPKGSSCDKGTTIPPDKVTTNPAKGGG